MKRVCSGETGELKTVNRNRCLGVELYKVAGLAEYKVQISHIKADFRDNKAIYGR